jgi:hypothetical protein
MVQTHLRLVRAAQVLARHGHVPVGGGRGLRGRQIRQIGLLRHHGLAPLGGRNDLVQQVGGELADTEERRDEQRYDDDPFTERGEFHGQSLLYPRVGGRCSLERAHAGGNWLSWGFNSSRALTPCQEKNVVFG